MNQNRIVSVTIGLGSIVAVAVFVWLYAILDNSPALKLQWTAGDTLVVRITPAPLFKKSVERVELYFEMPAQNLRQFHQVTWREGLHDTTLRLQPPSIATSIGVLTYSRSDDPNGVTLRPLPRRPSPAGSV